MPVMPLCHDVTEMAKLWKELRSSMFRVLNSYLLVLNRSGLRCYEVWKLGGLEEQGNDGTKQGMLNFGLLRSKI